MAKLEHSSWQVGACCSCAGLIVSLSDTEMSDMQRAEERERKEEERLRRKAKAVEDREAAGEAVREAQEQREKAARAARKADERDRVLARHGHPCIQGTLKICEPVLLHTPVLAGNPGTALVLAKMLITSTALKRVRCTSCVCIAQKAEIIRIARHATQGGLIKVKLP